MGDIRHIPAADILVKPIFELFGNSLKHMTHIGNLRRVPIMEGSVEIGSTVKHMAHVGDVRHIPMVEGLVEISGTVEHMTHIGDVA